MGLGINDIAKVDLNLKGIGIGNIRLRNYGESDTSISVEPLDENLYNEKVGAFGDMLLNKNYKGRNKLVKINVLRQTADYAKLQAIIANEEAGLSNIFTVTLKDNNTKESYISTACVMKRIVTPMWGPNPEGDVEYQILMSSAIHTPPTQQVV